MGTARASRVAESLSPVRSDSPNPQLSTAPPSMSSCLWACLGGRTGSRS